MKHYNVVCAVIMNDGEVLCMQRGPSKYEYITGHWEFPGGKIEEGETPEEALHRELLEEMDYDVKVGEHIVTVTHEYPDFAITMSAYLCSAPHRDFNRKEHSGHIWLAPSQLMTLPWCEADKPIAEEITVRMY